MKKIYCSKCVRYILFKIPTYHIFELKICFFLLFVLNALKVTIKYSNEKNLLENYKFFDERFKGAVAMCVNKYV